ncbi:16S rRNA (uracil(1498)-N(3))-methyltransferase [Trueperella pyogenes]|uniref:16S rRNA (uracil(1498)-N(3))-methyltransferase n=1 Tax=Trueperella pyogenes TaxID=1661 RepID=UPI0032472288
MTRPVYIDPDLNDAARVTLRGSEGHHAASVRRTRPGEQVDVVNGMGLRVTIDVDTVTKGGISGNRVASLQEEPARQRLTIVQALAKRGHDEQALETCTEYGADAFIPWMSERSIVRWNDPAKADKGRTKLADAVWAAAKQSRRAFLPRVLPVHTTTQLVQAIKDFDGVTLVCHEDASIPITDLLPIEADLMIVVGPEGGISAAEVDAFEQAGARLVLLGEHVMRSATAGAWACAVVRAYNR